MNEDPKDPARAIADSLAVLHRHSPAGYAIALHLRLQSPLYLFVTLPHGVARAYEDRDLAPHDPTVRWALTHTGRIAWRSLAEADPGGVLAFAAEHAMRHGTTIAILRGGSRSLANLTRPDRDLSPAEEDEAEKALVALHDATHPEADLDAGQRDALRRLSVAFSTP